MKLKILVGTMTDTAESVAQSIQMACADQVDSIEVQRMDGLDTHVFDENALFLMCSSTYGTGDVPDNAQALYLSLDAEHLRHILHEQRLARAEVSIEADNRPLMQFLAHHLRKLCRFCRRPRDSRKHFGSIHS